MRRAADPIKNNKSYLARLGFLVAAHHFDGGNCGQTFDSRRQAGARDRTFDHLHIRAVIVPSRRDSSAASTRPHPTASPCSQREYPVIASIA